MPKETLMFGSIGSIAETSDVQRRAYNLALREAGLDWEWDRATYSDLLKQSGGRERLSQLSSATGASLDPERIEAIHRRKTEIACAEIERSGMKLRPGVIELIRHAKGHGVKIALVTTTYKPNIDAILSVAGDALSAADFELIVSRDDVQNGKPSPDAYLVALRALGVNPRSALAIEDTAASVMSAKRAGIDVIATPGEFTADQDFWQADLTVKSLASVEGELDTRVTAMLAQ